MKHRTVYRLIATLSLQLSMVTCLVVVGSLALSQTAYAAKKLPEESPEGLKLLPDTKVSAVYLRDGVSFAGYNKVAILDCYVAFRKDWKRDQNQTHPFKVDDKDMLRIKTELADEFKKVFSKQLTAKGETLVTTGGSGVLILRPAIINLDVTAPDTMTPGSRSFSASAGSATLYLELLDGVTGELLVRVLDFESADSGFVEVRNGVTNRADAQRMLKKWADLLGTALQKARASVSPTEAVTK